MVTPVSSCKRQLYLILIVHLSIMDVVDVLSLSLSLELLYRNTRPAITFGTSLFCFGFFKFQIVNP